MTPVVSFAGVEVTYPGSPPVPALQAADLVIEPGEYVTVVGPSGSGKSTFLNVIGLLKRPTGGTYELDGIDVGTLSERRRTALRGQRVGFVFQAYHLLPYRSAVENVALARLYRGVAKPERILAAHEAVGRVGLAQRANALPGTLSGGERQRVAIARSLVHRPSLLLCDEPTGNLDTHTAASVLGLLEELHHDGMTLVIVTHDPDVAARGSRTITIRDGVMS